MIERATDARTLAIKHGMSVYDMEANPDEQYYARQYWHWLEPELKRVSSNGALRILDIGCGQGRLSTRIARDLPLSSVTGVDLAGGAIETAREKAAQQNVTNVEFHAADARSFVAALPEGSFDVALMTEVSFFMSGFRDVVAAAHRALRPGGLFFGSFRSQYFNLLHSIRDRDWRGARLVVDAREGEWGGGVTWFTWQTTDDVRSILTTAGFEVRGPMRGIGTCSGIQNDPLSVIARPSLMTETERERLMDIELAVAEEYAACGRYIVAVGVKS